MENLEYGFLELPRPDLTIFLYMPYKKVAELKKGRIEPADQHEASTLHIRNAEHAYLELAELHGYKTIECVDSKNKLRDIEDIHEDVYKLGDIELTYSMSEVWDMIQKSSISGIDDTTLEDKCNYELLIILLNLIEALQGWIHQRKRW